MLYVSPLKALSNDVQRNLAEPLAEMRELAAELGSDGPRVTAGPHRRHAAGRARGDDRKPPHILVTTPESLYLLLDRRAQPRCCGRCGR